MSPLLDEKFVEYPADHVNQVTLDNSINTKILEHSSALPHLTTLDVTSIADISADNSITTHLQAFNHTLIGSGGGSGSSGLFDEGLF